MRQPGAMQILPIRDESNPSFLVHGFSANDPTSTLNIWERVKQLNSPTEDPVVIINCRSDRVDRTEQFVSKVLPYLPAETLVLTGALDLEGYETGGI